VCYKPAAALRYWPDPKVGRDITEVLPGSPWENGQLESFHDKLRDECLNCEFFGNLREVRVILESWRVEYNERRPHSALGYRTPSEYVPSGMNRV
jgi:putative transposase